MKRVNISISLNQDIIDILKNEAAAEGRSLANYLRWLVTKKALELYADPIPSNSDQGVQVRGGTPTSKPQGEV